MSNKELFWAVIAFIAGILFVGTLDYADERKAECKRFSKTWNSETDKCQ